LLRCDCIHGLHYAAPFSFRSDLPQERLKLGVLQAFQSLREVFRKCNAGVLLEITIGHRRPAPEVRRRNDYARWVVNPLALKPAIEAARIRCCRRIRSRCPNTLRVLGGEIAK
jgi:hypothetical protein